MLKPHVMKVSDRRLGGSHRLRLTAMPLSGAGAAGFARSIMGRIGTEENELYPDAWLVLRQQEEREAQQQLQQNQLTQLTLRLAIQFSQSYLMQKMGEGSIRETDEAVSRHAAQHSAVSTHKPREKTAAGEMERQVLLRTLEHYLTSLEQQDRETVREVRTLLALTDQSQKQTEPMPHNEVRQAEAEAMLRGLEQQLIRVEHETRQLIQDFPGAVQTIQSPVNAGHSKARHFTEGRSLDQHKRRFVDLFQAADQEEQERIWALTTESTELAVRYQRSFEQEEHLENSEKLIRLVRAMNQEEYTELITMLARALPGEKTKKELKIAPEEEQLLVQAGPVLQIVNQALSQKRIMREQLWQEIQTVSKEAAKAYLILAEKSDIVSASKALKEKHLTEDQKFEQLIRKVKRADLTEITKELNTKVLELQGEVQLRRSQQEETIAMTRLRRMLTQSQEQCILPLDQTLEHLEAEERLSLNQGAVELAARQGLLTSAEGGSGFGDSEPLVYLLEHSAAPAETVRQLLESPAIKELEQRRTTDRSIIERLNTFTSNRGGQRDEQTKTLLSGLDRDSGFILLQRLESGGVVPTESTVPRDRPLERLEELLTFRTQKDYKSFRYHLNEYLKQVELPSDQIGTALLHWADEETKQREQETRDAVAQLTETRPEAWTRALLPRQARTLSGGDHTVERELILRAVTKREGPVYQRLTNLLSEQKPAPDVVAAAISDLASHLPQPEHRSGPTETIRERTFALIRQTQKRGKLAEPKLLPYPSPMTMTTVEREPPVYRKEQILRETLEPALYLVRQLAAHRAERMAVTGERPIALTGQSSESFHKEHLQRNRILRERLEQSEELRQITHQMHRKEELQRHSSLDSHITSRFTRDTRQLLTNRQIKVDEHRLATTTDQKLTHELNLIHEQLDPKTELELLRQREGDHRDNSLDSRIATRFTRNTRQLLTERHIKVDEHRLSTATDQKLTHELRQIHERLEPQIELELLRPGEEANAPQIIPERNVRPAEKLVQARILKNRLKAPEPNHWALPRAARVRPIQPMLSALSPEPEATDMRYEGKGQILELRREKPKQTAQAAEQTAARSAELIVQKQAPQLQLLRRQDQEQAQKLERQEQDMQELRNQLAQQEALVKKALERELSPKEEKVQVKTLAKAVMKELEGQLRLERQRRGLI